MLVDWIIYYGDGSTFSSDDGPPENAPRTNVQVVVRSDPELGRVILNGYGNDYDYYCWHDDVPTWVPHNAMGFEQYMNAPGATKIRLCGYWIADEQFHALYNKAADDTFEMSKTGTKYMASQLEQTQEPS